MVATAVRSEPRSLNPSVQRKHLSEVYRAVLEDAEDTYNCRVRNGEFNRSGDESQRSSPGGPDPQHH
ncbi:hypothetical protein LOK49_LG09G00839 [Camellia lanceoleosa]|uniref:Uncharacterized protein n=1 Tax=Camellia lanceoleosa TaxID=1840588 RepID=A0ACC0GHI7_9ERIC|nr:hypothetical protein LOK49_LG09G00839 [Camellia lanceoleosa]